MAAKSAVRGNVYTSEQIYKELKLLDCPFLYFHVKDGEQYSVIQTSHVMDDDLLAIPGFKDLRWIYIRTTLEWIPVFHAVNDEEVQKLIDYEKAVDPHKEQKDWGYWVTPKGHPRQQQYKLLPNNCIVNTYTGKPWYDI